MIAVFYGKDDFSAHEALGALRRELEVEGLLPESIDRVEGESARPDELLAACRTLPFLSPKRLVIVRGLLGRFEMRGRGRGGAKALGPWAAFAEGLRSLPETTVLVFIDGDVGASNPLLKALRPPAGVREFKRLPQAQLAGWIIERAAGHGVALEARAVATLAALVGPDLGLLDSELQKLAVYANGERVTEADVRSLVSAAREPSVFAMADAVVEGRTRDAADLVQRLLVDGEAPQYLLAMIARQYRLLLRTRDALDRGVRAPEIGARLQVQGFVAQRLLQQAPAYFIEALRRAYRRVLEADLSIKRGIYDEETALQLLVQELAALTRGGASPAGRRGYSTPPGGRPPAPSGAGRAGSGKR